MVDMLNYCLIKNLFQLLYFDSFLFFTVYVLLFFVMVLFFYVLLYFVLLPFLLSYIMFCYVLWWFVMFCYVMFCYSMSCFMMLAQCFLFVLLCHVMFCYISIYTDNCFVKWYVMSLIIWLLCWIFVWHANFVSTSKSSRPPRRQPPQIAGQILKPNKTQNFILNKQSQNKQIGC